MARRVVRRAVLRRGVLSQGGVRRRGKSWGVMRGRGVVARRMVRWRVVGSSCVCRPCYRVVVFHP